MLSNARRRILVADHSKFAKVAACKLTPITEMTTLVTDQPPPKAFQRLMRDGHCELIVASGLPERHIPVEDENGSVIVAPHARRAQAKASAFRTAR